LPPGVTSNTLVETTDSSGHHTIIPFFWHCWFCGGGGLFGWGIGKLFCLSLYNFKNDA
jgi:hypothetical protein